MAQITQEELMRAMQSGGASGGLLQAMQARLEGLVGKSSGLIETLPKPIQRRIKYLQTLQEEYNEREEEYERELDALDKKYEKIYAPIFAKRAEVVKGKLEAPEDVVLDDEAADADETGPAGVPEFWLGVLRANEVTASQITEKDEEVLEYLVDIRSQELSGEGDGECGFEITFEFAENPFFENSTLVKTYYMVDTDEPVLEKATGSKIEWKSGKNVTVKVLKKKAKPGKKPSKPIIKTEPVASFFSFFTPPKVPDEGDEDLEEEEVEALQAALEEDYEIGEVIRDQLIPNAVSWYTGEAGEDEDEDDDEEEEDEDDEDDDDDDDDEDDDSEDDDSDDEDAPKAAKAPTDAKEQPAECKQQ